MEDCNNCYVFKICIYQSNLTQILVSLFRLLGDSSVPHARVLKHHSVESVAVRRKGVARLGMRKKRKTFLETDCSGTVVDVISFKTSFTMPVVTQWD